MENKIIDIKAYEILDSRGFPTVYCQLFFKKKNKIEKTEASVPSGASVGFFESFELRDKDPKRFNGLGVKKACLNIEKKIKPLLKNFDVTKQKDIDNAMNNLDGTSNKSKIGSNAILAVSMAVCKAGAIIKNKSLYEYIGSLNQKKIKKLKFPQPFFNILNGGVHAGNQLAFQEFMITFQEKKFSQNYQKAGEFYQLLKKKLKEKYGLASTLVGDERGFAPNFQKAEEALNLITETAKKNKIKNYKISLDVAASEFFEKKTKKYNLLFKSSKKSLLTEKDLIKYYKKICQKYPIFSIEDPFEENDFENFALLKKELKTKIIVTDDLTVSNKERVKKAILEKSGSCLLLKINQIGTITEAIESAQIAKKAKWKIMVSHRSGETNDSFIADFALGIEADYLKSGAPCGGERVSKYNRLLLIENENERKK